MKKLHLIFVMAIALLSTAATAQMGSVLPIGRSFIIQSAQNSGRNAGGCWDVAGYYGQETDFIKGKNICIWQLDEGADRVFTIMESSQQGYYELMVGRNSVARVDIGGGNQRNGTNIQLWDDNNATSQRFLFKHLGNGRFKIYTTNGKIINLAAKGSKDGNNIQLWNDHNGIHNEWVLLDPDTRQAYIPTATVSYTLKGTTVPANQYYIQSAVSYNRNSLGFWDIPGSGTSKLMNNSNLQIYTKGNKADRKYIFTKNGQGQYYNIQIGYTRYRVTVLGSKTNNGSNVGAYGMTARSNQDFYLKHLGNGRFKIYHKSGKLLALSTTSDNNKVNIHLWQDHNAVQAEWYLIDVATGQALIPNGNSNSSEGNGWDGENNEGGSSGSESGGW